MKLIVTNLAEIVNEDQRDAAAETVRPPLRVCLLLDSNRVPAWTARMIETIASGDDAKLVGIVYDGSEKPREPLGKRFRHSLFSLYHRFDRRLFRARFPKEPDAFEQRDVTDLLTGVPTLQVTPTRRGIAQYFSPAELEEVRKLEPDVLIRIGFGILRGEILQAARYGVWSLHHGDNRLYRGAPAMFWEMKRGEPVTGVTLQILNEKLDAGKVIYRSFSKTNEVSLQYNYNVNYWRSAEFIPRRLRELRRFGPEFLHSLETYREPPPTDGALYRMPTNWTTLGFLASLAGRHVRRLLERSLTRENWFIAWRRRPAGAPLGDIGRHDDHYVLQPPRGRFYADPFFAEHAGATHLFFEDFDYATSRALISYTTLDEAGQPSAVKPAVDADYHLSYPFVFEHDGRHYMIPETRNVRRVELWRAERFPDHWVRDRVLLDDVGAVDATWLAHEGRYFLFVNLANTAGSPADELHAFVSSQPFGPWKPHPLNPIVSDVRRSRPAGAFFRNGDDLIRPSQDGSGVYGRRVVFNRVEVLNEREYRETPVAAIEPGWYPGNVGTHTYNRTTDFEVVDGRTRRFRF